MRVLVLVAVALLFAGSVAPIEVGCTPGALQEPGVKEPAQEQAPAKVVAKPVAAKPVGLPVF
jgi:hypothetical protein